MTLHVLNEISDYWDTSKNTLTHDFTKLMPKNRFQELYIRVRLARMDANGAYAKVSKAPLISLLFFVKF
jgi:hypothetical protein